ncbi:hypothetical protein [Natronolimnobius baerhuensis]|uniref:hypothetical protein n=1 Tax=Natronolimnobius baerhuensis TaxID=253108 RepID=UPI001124FFC3|nr:hypothetical protein [Natronolimnobius baerhuensis]
MRSYDKNDYRGMGLTDAEIDRIVDQVMSMSRCRDAQGRFDPEESADHQLEFVPGTDVAE